MDINVYLFIVIALMLLIIMYLLFVLRRVRTQLALIKDALEDIKGGNLNRRILAGENDMTKTICYDINKIAVNSQAQLIRQRQSEQAYKRLMTSLSHDVKTPLASLVGYLEAVENKIVIGEEKDEYIHVAHEKAHYMKSFVENLFVQIAPQSAVSSGVTEDTTLAPSIPCSLRKVENALRKMAAVSIRHKNVFFFILFYLEFYRFCCFTESSFVRFYNISGQFYIIRSLCFLKGVFCFFRIGYFFVFTVLFLGKCDAVSFCVCCLFPGNSYGFFLFL